MARYEKHLLDNFDTLYQTTINGMKWEDCCDYEEVDGKIIPTWMFFTNDKYYIEGLYDSNLYNVYYHHNNYDGDEEPIKTFKTLKGAMRYCNEN